MLFSTCHLFTVLCSCNIPKDHLQTAMQLLLTVVGVHAENSDSEYCCPQNGLGGAASPTACHSDPRRRDEQVAPMQDCKQAIATLKGNSTRCLVPPPLKKLQNQYATAVEGNCAVVLVGSVEEGLPCFKAAEYAEQLANACSTAQQATGGSYDYPECCFKSTRIVVQPASRYQ